MELNSHHSLGRRESTRIAHSVGVVFSFRNDSATSNQNIIGTSISIDIGGMSCKLPYLPDDSRKILDVTVLDRENSIQCKAKIVWLNKTKSEIGIKFIGNNPAWAQFATYLFSSKSVNPTIFIDRRRKQRRDNSKRAGLNGNRISDRRFSALISENAIKEIDNKKKPKIFTTKFPPYSMEALEATRALISEQTGTKFSHIKNFSEDTFSFKGKIENPIGVAHIPLGITGPLKVNGQHAQGIFYVPLATTEGALVTSYSLGSNIITRSGGANVCILNDNLKIGPVFIFKNLLEAKTFERWLIANFEKIKEIAESTSKHLTLKKCEPIINGRRVNLNFHYDTGDAMGMNMACKATETACEMIVKSVRPEEFWLRSNFNSNKKATANHLTNGYGKTVTADITIPRKLISILNTTPEQIQRYAYRALESANHAGMIGSNGHFANGLTALYIACGQDVALIANSHVGITTCEVTSRGDLYFSIYLSSLLVGTVGGGTDFGTAKECLDILDCYGSGKVKKFAEIVGALVLAGEISIGVSIVNGTYVHAHETLGRNKTQFLPLQ